MLSVKFDRRPWPDPRSSYDFLCCFIVVLWIYDFFVRFASSTLAWSSGFFPFPTDFLLELLFFWSSLVVRPCWMIFSIVLMVCVVCRWFCNALDRFESAALDSLWSSYFVFVFMCCAHMFWIDLNGRLVVPRPSFGFLMNSNVLYCSPMVLQYF